MERAHPFEQVRGDEAGDSALLATEGKRPKTLGSRVEHPIVAEDRQRRYEP